MKPGYSGQSPISRQPTRSSKPFSGEWMSSPGSMANCPRGLEVLTKLDKIFVNHNIEAAEVFTGFEVNNKYTVRNANGQNVYYAVEDCDILTRNCCGDCRPYNMIMFDNFQNQVINFYRPHAFWYCGPCCACSLESMEVSAPPHNVIARIEQECSKWRTIFSVNNRLGDTVLRIEGPYTTCCYPCTGDIEFKVVSLDGEILGKISKKWTNLAREFLSTYDFFGVSFPMDLDVHIKAALLGATFLIVKIISDQNRIWYG